MNYSRNFGLPQDSTAPHCPCQGTSHLQNLKFNLYSTKRACTISSLPQPSKSVPTGLNNPLTHLKPCPSQSIVCWVHECDSDALQKACGECRNSFSPLWTQKSPIYPYNALNSPIYPSGDLEATDAATRPGAAKAPGDLHLG